MFDVLTFEESNKFELILKDENQELETDNIITKAVKLLEQKVKKNLNVKITLQKNIPIGAGLGGGSSDGASTLMAINIFFNLNLSLKELEVVALELGSDVPLFLYDYPTVGKSRGEDLVKQDIKINKPILLVNPGIHISTKEAFANIIPKSNGFDYSNINHYKISEW